MFIFLMHDNTYKYWASSHFPTSRKILSEGKVNNISYGFGKNVNTFFNSGGRALVEVIGFVWGGKDEFSYYL